MVYHIDDATSSVLYAWGTNPNVAQSDSFATTFQVDGKTLRLGTEITFAFTISDDGNTVEGVRQVNRGATSRITMSRCTLAYTATSTSPGQQHTSGTSPFVWSDAAVQSMKANADEMLSESARPWIEREPRRELQINDRRTNTAFYYSGQDGRELSTVYSIDPEGKPRFTAIVVRAANVHNARNNITADAIYGTLARYFSPFPEPFHTAIWKQYRQPSGAPTIERAWDNEDGTVEGTGASLWGHNEPNGPGNYMVYRARFFPGSPHHAARTLFTS